MVPREIPQAAFLAMEKAGVSFQTQQRVWPIMLDALATQPAQESEAESQRYTEDDGCPTELAVLQRFWRANQPATSSQETASE